MTKNDSSILLGFDFGMKRIGVAVGQMITRSARPLETIQAKEGIPEWNKVSKLIKNWQPAGLVVGVPLNMDGTPQPLTTAAEQFIRSLKDRFHLPVYGIDERLSTKDARERLFNEGGYKSLQNGQVDRVAAQLILEHWISLQPKEP